MCVLLLWSMATRGTTHSRPSSHDTPCSLRNNCVCHQARSPQPRPRPTIPAHAPVRAALYLVSPTSLLKTCCVCVGLCVANACTTKPSTAAGYGTQCSSLVTDGTCTQTCNNGYVPAGSGAYTCVAGTLGGGSLTCTAVACPANSAGNNVGSGCVCATGYTGLRRDHRCR